MTNNDVSLQTVTELNLNLTTKKTRRIIELKLQMRGTKVNIGSEKKDPEIGECLCRHLTSIFMKK